MQGLHMPMTEGWLPQEIPPVCMSFLKYLDSWGLRCYTKKKKGWQQKEYFSSNQFIEASVYKLTNNSEY